MASIEQILQPTLSELFFCGIPVLVEGTEDVAFLSTYLQLSGRWSEFRRHGCHFVVVGGKENMSRPLAMAMELGIPVLVVFDADGNAKPDVLEQHRRANARLLHLCGAANAEPFPTGAFIGERVIVWENNIGQAARDDIGEAIWDAASQRARVAHGYEIGVRKKNALLIAATLEELVREGQSVPALDRACDAILGYAQRSRSSGTAAQVLHENHGEFAPAQ